MNRKHIIVIAVVAILLSVTLIFYLLRDKGGPGDEVDFDTSPDHERVTSSDGFWPDAPAPEIDPEELRKLWPDVFLPKPDKAQAEREWRDFAKKYPNNLYIPSVYAPEPSESEKKDRLKTLDTIGDVESKLAIRRSQLNRDAKPGTDGPEGASEPDVSPDDQRTYFNYRINELESRIQLIEYFLNQGSADQEQRNIANTDLANWKKELSEYKRVYEEIPK